MTIRERACRSRSAVKVTPSAPSCGAWKRILSGIAARKSVMSESLGRLELAVRVGRRGRGEGVAKDGSAVEEGIVKDYFGRCYMPRPK